jgi:hypothetical protein
MNLPDETGNGMSDKQEFEITDESIREDVFNHVEQGADKFQTDYVESEEEKEEIRRYQQIVSEIRKENRPKRVLKWKPWTGVVFELTVFFWKFLFLYGSIGYILWTFNFAEITLYHFINTFVLTVILILFKQWWNAKTEDRQEHPEV